MFLVLLTGLALGQALVEGAPVDLPDVPVDAALVDRDGEPWLLFAAESGVWAVDPLSGALDSFAEEPAVAVEGLDPEGDGEHVLLWCDDAALHRLQPGAEASEVLLEQPCAALESFHLDGRDGLAVATETFLLWEVIEGALAEAPVDLGRETELPVGFAADRWVLGAFAGDALVDLGWESATQVSFSARADGLAAWQGTLVWRVDGWPYLGLVGDQNLDTHDVPGPMAGADLQADGLEELVVTYPEVGVLGVWAHATSEERTAGAEGAVDLVAGDLDGDGCEDVVVLEEDRATPWFAPCEAGLALEVTGEPVEGNALRVFALEWGALPEGTNLWSVDGDTASCVQDDEGTLVCQLLDQGTLLVGLDRYDLEGAVVASAATSVEVTNRAPFFDPCPSRMHAFVDTGFEGPGEATIDYVVRDVAADPITLELVMATTGCEVEDHLDEGWLIATCAQGDPTSGVQVRATDGDGGEAECGTRVDVGPPRPETFEDWYDYERSVPLCVWIGFILVGLPFVPLLLR